VTAPYYRMIPSLREYLFVSQKEARVEHYVRGADGSWTLRDVRPPEKLRLAIGGEIDLAKLYEDRLNRSGAGSA
jgi:Uma2 family endonuclease